MEEYEESLSEKKSIHNIALIFISIIGSIFIISKEYLGLIVLVIIFLTFFIRRFKKDDFNGMFKFHLKEAIFFLMEFFIFYFVSIVLFYYLAVIEKGSSEFVDIALIMSIFGLLFGISFSLINLVIQKNTILKGYTVINLNCYFCLFISSIIVVEGFNLEGLLNFLFKLNSYVVMTAMALIPIFLIIRLIFIFSKDMDVFNEKHLKK